MNTPVRVGETIEGSRTMRNRLYPVLKRSSWLCVSRLAGLGAERRNLFRTTLGAPPPPPRALQAKGEEQSGSVGVDTNAVWVDAGQMID